MQKKSNIKELFQGDGERLTSLKERLQERSRILGRVLEALPPELRKCVLAAGVEGGQLTIGAVNASWATRLRYHAQALKKHLSGTLGVEIVRIRVRVQPALPGEPLPPR